MASSLDVVDWPVRTERLVLRRLADGDLMVRRRDAYAQREVADRAAGSEAELGWTFDPAHQGRGLATEAVRALITICFDDLGLHRVAASCFTDNEPSWRLMERVGMRREAHHVADSLHREHGWLDTACGADARI